MIWEGYGPQISNGNFVVPEELQPVRMVIRFLGDSLFSGPSVSSDRILEGKTSEYMVSWSTWNKSLCLYAIIVGLIISIHSR